MPQLIDEFENARVFKGREDYVTHLWWKGRPEAYVIFRSPSLSRALRLTSHRVTGHITSDLSLLTPADVMSESRLALPRFPGAFVTAEDDEGSYGAGEITYDDYAPIRARQRGTASHDDGYVDESDEDEPSPPNQWDATVDAALLSEEITL